MLFLHYRGEFLSRAGVCWRAEIFNQAPGPYRTIGALTFEADEAITIEWPEKSKESVLCGSTCTIRIESPGDRTYAGLYQISTRQVRLDLYRNDVLYWSGCLDPEFYEEPYEREKYYTVSLTFSDFGVLDRLKYNLSGMQTLAQILYHCLGESGITYAGVDESLISTRRPNANRPLTLSEISVRSDNFYDEDGEASSLDEVLTGIFQPLGLRMIQRAGQIYIYDLNGLYNAPQETEVVWSGDSSTMSVDSVYNNATITFSPYAQSGNLAPEECWLEELKTPVNKHKLLYGDDLAAAHDEKTGCDYVSYFLSTDTQDWADDTDLGFTLWTSEEGEHAEINTAAGVRYYKVVPQNDGDEDQGVLLRWPQAAYKPFMSSAPGINWDEHGIGVNLFNLLLHSETCGEVLCRSDKVWLPPVPETTALLINVTQGLLIDPRINIYESAENLDGNDTCNAKDSAEMWNAIANFVFVPVTIKFKPDNSDTVYVWDNRAVVNKPADETARSFEDTLGRWVPFSGAEASPSTFGWLGYYDPFDRKESSACGSGWATNRQAINANYRPLLTSIQQLSDGQRLPYPTRAMGSGMIWVEIRKGWRIRSAYAGMGAIDFKVLNLLMPDNGRQYHAKWVALRLPQIEVVNNSWFDTEISNEDIEYSAEINPDAKEGIDISTICGTGKEGQVLARGAYFANGTQVTALTRAGRTDVPEELLIGTIYSQYADRCTKLTGEIELHPTGLTPYTEANQRERKFIMVGETQDVITDTTNATLIELRPDEYTKDNE